MALVSIVINEDAIMRYWIVFLVSFNLVWPTSSHAQAPAPTPPAFDPQALQAELLAALPAQRMTGVTVMVLEGDSMLYHAGLGQAADGGAMNPNASYHLGRAAEPFLTTLAFMKAEKGLLTPDMSIAGLLPTFTLPERPNATAALTLQDLMTHTGGLGRDNSTILRPLPAAEFASSTPEFFPGLRFSYCHRCTGLLVDVLEAQGGAPIADLLRQDIFYALQMDTTYVQGDELVTTAQDLSHFVAVHLQGGRWEGVQLVKPETVLAMHRPDPPTQRGPREFYGDGWAVTVDNGLPVPSDTPQLDHFITARDVGNYQAQITLIPAYRRAVILLTDQPTQGLDGLMEIALRHVADWSPPADFRPEAASTLAGQFRSQDLPFGGVLTLSAEGDRLMVEYDGWRGEARPIENRTYEILLPDGARWYLYFLETGRARNLILSNDWVTSAFVRQN
jgi:CubicO group peptidase (beta-lactamase class C family)